MEFERFLQIGQRLLFALALAGNIKFQALRDVPIALTPNGCGERSFHDYYSFTGGRLPPASRDPSSVVWALGVKLEDATSGWSSANEEDNGQCRGAERFVVSFLRSGS